MNFTPGVRCRRHNKECFASQEVADAALRQIKAANSIRPHEGRKVPDHSYYEPKCETWHLTSMKKKEEKIIDKIIVRPVHIEITREDLPLDGTCRDPRESSIFEARFAWEAGLRSEDYRSFRGYGATEQEAVAVLFQERERQSP